MKEETKSAIGGIVWGILAGLVMAIAFFSCSRYTPTKAVEQMNKANNTYPGTVAELTRKWYPCITRSSDTTVLIKDSLVYVNCPDLPEIITMPGSTDTVIKERIIKVPVTLPVRYVTIKEKVEDSAKIKAMQADLDRSEYLLQESTKANQKLQEKFDNMEDKRNWWRKWCLITWGIIALVICLRIALPKIPFLK